MKLKKFLITHFLITLGFLAITSTNLLCMQKLEIEDMGVATIIKVISEESKTIITFQEEISPIDMLEKESSTCTRSLKCIKEILMPCKSYITRKYLNPCKKSCKEYFKKSGNLCLEACKKARWNYAFVATAFCQIISPIGFKAYDYYKNK